MSEDLGVVVPNAAVTDYLERSAGKDYSNLSLMWVRDVLDVTGPKMPTVLAFADRYRDRLYPQPMIGQVVLWSTPYHGDIGIYVGKDQVLRMGADRCVYLHELPADPSNDDPHYLGAMWWPEEDG